MSIIQSTQNEIRYLKRKNLNEEARIIGNWYRDCIRMYGIDCIYWKMNTDYFDDFKNIIDQNTVLKRAYGYNITPQYNISAEMVTFAEIDQDIFALNKYGIIPQTDINLVFDNTQFACDLAPKLGIYKEYKIDECEVICELPEFSDEITSIIDPTTGNIISGHISNNIWPYELGLGYAESYTCGMLSGHMRCLLSGYELDKETTVICDPYEHTDFNIEFPANGDLYKSLSYRIANNDYLETMLFLTFKVSKIAVANNKYKYILRGKTHGSVLFFDIDRLGKYVELIHPDVGDIVEIDFPDENNREKYEITECFDRQLTQDGINPLLHKYVWKCKAKRYVNSYEDEAPPVNEADLRLDERRRYDEVIQEEVAKNVSMYDTLDKEGQITEDAAYGGYSGTTVEYDKQTPEKMNDIGFDYIEDGTAIDIMRFGCGSRLVTNGYDLIFIQLNGTGHYISITNKIEGTAPGCIIENGSKWLKASNDKVFFINIEGTAFKLCEIDKTEHINIDSFYDHTIKTAEINKNYDNFIKFTGTRTVIFATPERLCVKFSDKEIVDILN